MTARLCLYKGPATGFRNKLGHWIVRLVDTIRQSIRARRFVRVRYSHVELEINGACYSSSFRDGGVRSKIIRDLESSGHFDFMPIQIDEPAALKRFWSDQGKLYDWVGMLRVLPFLRWLPRSDNARFCSEEVAWMLGASDPERYSPYDLMSWVPTGKEAN